MAENFYFAEYKERICMAWAYMHISNERMTRCYALFSRRVPPICTAYAKWWIYKRKTYEISLEINVHGEYYGGVGRVRPNLIRSDINDRTRAVSSIRLCACGLRHLFHLRHCVSQRCCACDDRSALGFLRTAAPRSSSFGIADNSADIRNSA